MIDDRKVIANRTCLIVANHVISNYKGLCDLLAVHLNCIYLFDVRICKHLIKRDVLKILEDAVQNLP